MAPNEVVGVEIPRELLELIENKLKQKLAEQNLDEHHVTRMMRAKDGRWNAVIQSMVDLGKLRFDDEEVASTHTYDKFYKGPKPIAQQIDFLVEVLELDPTHALAYIQQLPLLPEGAEGWFAVPAIVASGRIMDSLMGKRVFGKLQEITDVDWNVDLEEGFIYNANFSREIQKVFSSLQEKQPGDIWIVPAQLGMRHRGRSARCAQEKYVGGEFSLSSYIVVSILLNHPYLLRQPYDLGIICAGDYCTVEWDGVSEDGDGEYSVPVITASAIEAGEAGTDDADYHGHAVSLEIQVHQDIGIEQSDIRRGSATGFLV